MRRFPISGLSGLHHVIGLPEGRGMAEEAAQELAVVTAAFSSRRVQVTSISALHTF